MAKKGGTVSLQVDIQTEEEWQKMLQEVRRVVIVADIYSEWCGPCTGMIGNLRKVKLEVGGDFIYYTTVKNDYINDLARFRRKSEPVWMFIVNGKMTNLMLGPDGPRLMRTIVQEVKKQKEVAENKRVFQGMEITDLSPEELHRIALKEAAEFEAKKAEREHLMKKLFERRLYVSETVGLGMPNHTVLVLWPHAKDALNEFMKMFENLGLEVVTYSLVDLTMDQVITGFFDAPPIELSRRAKLALTSGKSVVALIAAKEEGFTLPSVEVAMQMAIDSGLGEKWMLEYEEEVVESVSAPSHTEAPSTVETANVSDVEVINPDMLLDGDEGDEYYGTSAATTPHRDPTEHPPSEVPTIATTVTEPEPHIEEEPAVELIPGVYSPMTTISRGAALLAFFPVECKEVTPPEPVAVAPHSLLVFDAFKRKDVVEMINENIMFVMQIGFFTSDNPDTAELLAKTQKEYNLLRPNPDHKLCVQVMTKPSAGLLSLVQLGPTYCSPNPEVGEEECSKFFPFDYCPDGYQIEPEEEEIPEIIEEAERVVTKKSGKDKKKGKGAATSARAAEGDAPVAGDEEENYEEEGEEDRSCPLDDNPPAEEEQENV